MKKTGIILICSLLLCGCGYDKYKMPKDVSIVLNDNNYFVFEELYMGDLVSSANVELLNKDEAIVNNKTGEHIVTLEYKYKKRTYKLDITYNLIDNIPPIIMSASSVKTVLKNEDVYPCESAVYIDNYDRKPTCQIEGFYDTTTVGVYNVEYIISDNSKNETRKKLKINVVDKIQNKPSTNNNSTSTPTPKDEISDMITEYKNDNTMMGIDVSRWQGDIDFEQVKSAGVEFVMLRIGVQSGVKKDMELDSYYLTNIEKAKNAGLKVGVYVYTTATTEEKAREHAKWIVKNLNGLELNFPIGYDWENWAYIMEYEVSLHDMNYNFYAFADELKKAGYEAMLYSSKYYLERIWTNELNYPVWLAHYAKSTSYDKAFKMWQFSNKGLVPGIDSDVDLDIYYKS